ncbi:MAG TPA: two-component regulator propeller domain-containing protein [Cytophagales bacterium]|nr:two-component regulator propeller domain-containing protein [Cytophagales bacterium]
MSSVEIVCLLPDKIGNLWVGTLRGLEKYDKETDSFVHFSNYPAYKALEGVQIKSLLEDTKGNIWIGTYGKGLYKLNPGTKKLTEYRSSSGNQNSLSSDFINVLYQENQEELWIGTWQGGADKLHIVSGNIEHYQSIKGHISNAGVTINSITADKKGNILFGTWGVGICIFNEETKEMEKYNPLPEKKELLDNTTVISVYEDKDEILWATTFNKGIVAYDRQNDTVLNFRSELPEPFFIKSNITWDIFEDKYGVIWLSTYGGGIIKIKKNNNNFKHIIARSGNHPNSFISTIFQTHDNKIWVGTTEKGLNLLNTTTYSIREVLLKDSIFDYTVSCMAEDKEKNLWLGTTRGLVKYNPVNKSLSYIDPSTLVRDSASTLKELGILSICIDNEGWIWMGTFEEGLYRYNPETGVCFHYKHDENNSNSLSDNVIWTIFQDHRKNIWFGTRNILNRFDKEKEIFIHYKPNPKDANAISHNVISDIYEDSRKTLWFATLGGGLNKYRRGTDDFEQITKADGLSDDNIAAIVEDFKGNLWLSTTKKISRYNLSNHSIQNYDKSSGLSDNTFNINIGLRSNTGEIFFGGSNGINAFHPDSIKDFMATPEVVLTDFKRFNKSVSSREKVDGRILLKKEINELDKLVLSYSDYVISFEFSVLDYAYPETNKYAYKLEGFDEEWVYTDAKRRYAYYTNLPPGEYTLRVKATNHTGIWNNNEKKIDLIITPPFWQTIWFRAAVILLCVLAINIFIRLRIRNLKNQRKILKKIVYKKTQEIRSKNTVLEKNNEKLSKQKEEILAQKNEILEMSLKVREADEKKMKFFANISHEFRTPLTLILGPAENLVGKNADHEIKDQLKIIYKNAHQLLHMVNTLMDFQKLDNDRLTLQLIKKEIIEFVRDLVNGFKELAETKQINLLLSYSPEEFVTWFDPYKIQIILYNLISNAFKFTQENGTIKITLGVDETNRQLKFIVADNGIGIDPKKTSKIFDRYYQIENRSSYKGTGLGLAHTKELVDLMEGKIEVTSIPEQGTTFTICIPLLEEGQIKENEKLVVLSESHLPLNTELFKGLIPTENAVQSDNGNKTAILIIDDNEDLRSYIRSCLFEKYNIYEACNGNEGLLMAKEKLPKLIISDLMMPEMDGMEFCKRVKTDINISHIPVVLLTAKTDKASQIEGYETGADDYITKPFNKDLLMARIENLIQSREKLRRSYKSKLDLNPTEILITSVDEKFLQNALSIVEQHIADAEFGTSALVHELGMSRTLVHMKFKELTDLSTGEFIKITRLKRAAQLLKEKKHRVSDVCYLVGFTDPHYFSKSFKSVYGVSPSNFTG